MDEIDPTTVAVSIDEAAGDFGGVLDGVRTQHKRVVVEENGKPVAALVSIKDLARLRFDDAKRTEARAFFEQISERFADVPADVHEREVANAVAEARAERAEERERTQRSA